MTLSPQLALARMEGRRGEGGQGGEETLVNPQVEKEI